MTRRALEFGTAVLLTGLLAGVAGATTVSLLHAVEHLAYHYSYGLLLDGIGASSPVRRALAPAVGGALAGFGWWILRRRSGVPSLSATIAGKKPMQHLPMAADAALQVVAVGSGASLGRETAPRQLAAVLSSYGTTWLGRLTASTMGTLTARDREILLSCAAGAGLGAVYSVPLGGAFFAARVMMGSWHPRVVGTALLTSSLAVAVSRPVTHFERNLVWPNPALSYQFTMLAVAIAPLAVVVGLTFNRLVSLAGPKPQLTSWVLIPGVALAGLVTGICSIYRPELPGNGRSVLVVAVGSNLTLAAAVVILLLKPLLTALYLRLGAVGGLITPALATGAAAGTVATLALNSLAHTNLHVAAVALTCAAGVLAITQRAPAFAALFVWELAHPPVWLLLVFAVAAFSSHGIRLLREQSTARASERPKRLWPSTFR
ncbi:chloride channel protein [Mycolicibacterium aubagnense]|uniref:chloride channel protein n=1 Tax=Mycolicibacterium aubagnense TaxID=319707 RepID=UPI0010FD0753|nr:chloride channel protein [Mycolicibacterium aubagnense]TLH67541.1 chloride ion channel protein [Mycolicibacterium aubagnense]WGI31922.1 chloride channel protein [Mycolicibacterium aubagnense]